jgi:hypothetical protein
MQGGEDSIAGFDHVKLRQRLKGNTPLQWLFEKVFFDGYNLAEACARFDRDLDGTIARMYFKQVILTDVPAMHKGKRPGEYVTDFHKLMNVVPRSVLNVGDDQKDQRVYYLKLANELTDLAKLRLPVNVLYERHVIDIKKMASIRGFEENLSEENKKEADHDSVFTFKDPRLRHMNKNFKREEL